MNHQLFESWILDEERLNTEDEISLRLHLQTCPECQSLQENWKSIKREIQLVDPKSPQPGFTTRWVASLAWRRKLEYQRLERRLLIFLSTAFIFTLGAILSGLFLFTSPASMVAGIVEIFTRISIGFYKFLVIGNSILDTLPPVIPTFLMILASFILGITVLIWSLMIWRISQKGMQIS